MRILVTGASGVFGRDTTRRLWAKGHDVVALSRRPPEHLPSSVEFFPADIRDAAKVEKAMAGCDVVVHLAWTVTPLRTHEEHTEIDLGGTQNVLDAMARTGCGRLVYSSSVLAYGANPDNPPRLKESDPLRPRENQIYPYNKTLAEGMITRSGVPAVLARAAVVLGRQVDNMGMHVFATPTVMQVKGDHGNHQFIHQEDVGRFLAFACFSDKTGPVNLAADDVLTNRQLAAIVGKRVVTVSEKAVSRVLAFLWKRDLVEVDPDAIEGLRWMPVVDTTALREEWGFNPAWSSAQTAADFARSTSWFFYLGKKRVEIPWRTNYPDTRVPLSVAPPDGGELVAAARAGVAGEFDDLIDARYSTYTATNTSEAFPGPLTPLSVEVDLRAMRAAAEMTGFVQAAGCGGGDEKPPGAFSYVFDAAAGAPPDPGLIVIGSDGNDRIDLSPPGRPLGYVLAYGGDGADTITVGADFGPDTTIDADGGPGDDTLNGDAGNDRIFAQRGVDTVHGGPGNDDLWALARADVTGDPNEPADTLDGGPGNDVFHVRDGEPDHVDCGDGHDVVKADYQDVVAANCEVVKRHAPRPKGEKHGDKNDKKENS